MERSRDSSAPATAIVVAAVASAGGGLVHAAAAGTHNGDAALAWLFALCAAAQIGWAAAVVAWPRRRLLAAGVGFNAACVVVWALSRTVGLVGRLAGVETVGTQDLVAALLAAVAAVSGSVALLGRARDAHASRSAGRLHVPVLACATGLVVVLTVPAMATTHTHGNHDDHAGGEVVAADHAHSSDHTHSSDHAHTSDVSGAEHAHGAAAVTDEADGSDADIPTGPVVSLDDARLTSAQRARATSLLERTRATLAAHPDEATVVAAGYTWIGDGIRPGGFQHFVKADYLGDGHMLDPGRVESFVLEVQPDGSKHVVSAMYIAEPGTSMGTVPDIAGELTVWHDHQNLCWEGNRLAGFLVDGVCRPGGTFRGTQPMIHVWADDPPCGPFTGVEGHGGGTCAHAH